MPLQSNALNYPSFGKGNVDPRTGLYGFTLEVPELNANFGQGPNLPLQLGFSPLNTTHSGFGIGWAFKLSSYDLDSQVLSLYTGESLAIADQGPGEEALVYEQKLKSFICENIGDKQNPRFRITHTGGPIEILEPLKADSRKLLPTRVTIPGGAGINLAYDLEKGRLQSIQDDSGQQLLTLTFQGDSQTLLQTHPGTEAEQTFTLKFEGEELRTLVLPTSDQHNWAFHYQQLGGMRFLQRLTLPYGGEERVIYRESGHQYPGRQTYLPYVTEHRAIADPLNEANAIKTTYTYTKKNFLGYGATGVEWDEKYNQDHLYKFTGSEYVYGSTTNHYLNDEVLRTVEHTFNRFHLVTKQVTDEAGRIETITTQYHDKPGNFASQDPRVQLPSRITKTWTQAGTQLRRDEHVLTQYDEHGNMVLEQLANGTRMVREYYPAAGAEGCPPDPQGFVRNLKSLTVYPAEGGAQAQIRRTRFTYRALDVLSASVATLQADKFLVGDSEQIFEVTDDNGQERERLLSRSDISHLDTPDNVFLHGRIDYRTDRLGTTQSRTEWHYEKRADDNGKLTYLNTTTTFKPHGGTLEKTTQSLQSALRNQLIETEDINGVKTRYRHDAINRPVATTIAPDLPEFTATYTFRYGKVTENNRTLCYAEHTDLNGVVTRTYHDGLNRPVRVELTLKALDNPESETRITRKVSETTYDGLGRIASETVFDYAPVRPGSGSSEERVIERTTRFKYDAWGQRCEVLQADDVKLITAFSPFGADGNKAEQWLESPKQPGIKQQHSVVEYNRFDKPVYEYQLHQPAGGAKPVEVDRTDYLYDGLGRGVKETFSYPPEQKLVPRITEYTYDHWGRMCETVRPDGSVLLRSFAEHSTNELTTLLQVRNKNGSTLPVCKRTYDGLERLTSMAVGPRLETYTYQGQTALMDSRTISNTDATRNDKRKHVERYTYKPALTTQPTSISATLEGTPEPHAANEASFAYRPSSAEVVGADNANGSRAYTYTDRGYLAQEHWHVGDQEQYNIHNQHSLQGRLRYRKHSDGAACLYEHDKLGRVVAVTQGHLQSTLTYNSEGRLETTTTHDTRDPARYVRSTQTYDDLGREHRRTLDANGQQQLLVLKWRDGTTLQARTLYNGNAENEAALLREEVFGYDELDRLTISDYRGPSSPRNAKGRTIESEIFEFDAMDNLKQRVTLFADGKKDTARFTYATDGSFQLTKVTHTLVDDYLPEQSFDYDTRGNMLNDEQGRTLEYDVKGRLERVLKPDGSEQARYLYDGHDQLLASVFDGRQVQRRYQGNRLDSTREGNLLTQYLLNDEQTLGVQRSDQPDDPLLLLTDPAGSILTEADHQGTRHASYNTYGERPDDNGMRCLLAFNGEVREEALGWYLLGSGYRAYNPGLMRFHSPDSLPPEAAGLNPYLYALGNPVKWRDPTGHKVSPFSGNDGAAEYKGDSNKELKSKIKTGLLVLFSAILLISLLAAPWGTPMSLGTALAWGGIAGQGVGLGLQVAGKVIEENDSGLSDILSFTGVGISILGAAAFGAGMAINIKSGAMRSSLLNFGRPKTRPWISTRLGTFVDHNKGIDIFGKPFEQQLAASRAWQNTQASQSPPAGRSNSSGDYATIGPSKLKAKNNSSPNAYSSNQSHSAGPANSAGLANSAGPANSAGLANSVKAPHATLPVIIE
ncbi:RHS repeat domain-containing protein [Pseudomonas putida]|uniref:RHS repeat-associated core domain-containing protein n=1 Tax=Pseudomonas putida TaxID=303 RepID=A0A6I7ETQ9_PSEPU|nr:RHS repeat-associated core domain-containing protein [Pseudomonas putida]QHW08389.1 RHS repeat-associated core domain-containing protein [Pseudomonas putida]